MSIAMSRSAATAVANIIVKRPRMASHKVAGIAQQRATVQRKIRILRLRIIFGLVTS
jgi:hypothetical protein